LLIAFLYAFGCGPPPPNSSPTIANPSVSGALTAGQAGTVAVSCTATDTDGTVQSVTADLSGIGGANAQPLTKGSSDQWSWSGPVTPATSGSKTATFTATDDKGATGTGLASVTVASPGTGALFVEVPDPLSGENPVYPLLTVGVPAAGQSVTDDRLKTTQTRVVQTEGLVLEYSRFDPFNCDRSMILLFYFPTGEWRVYRTNAIPYDRSDALVMVLNMEEPRWDPNDPNVIWGHQDFQLLTVNVSTGQTNTIKDFAQEPQIATILAANPDLYRITMTDEGESSTDKRFWAFLVQGSNEDYRLRYLFTWDRQLDQILGLYTIPPAESDIDWAGMSPKGNWVLIGGAYDNGGNLVGLTMANKELTQFHRLDHATAHSDVGLDSQGNEVIVMQNVLTDSIDLIPLDPNTKPILETFGSYEGTNRTRLVRLFYDSTSSSGLHSGVHISCNHPGYCVVSTYIEPNLPEQNWLDRSIILVKLDRLHPRAFYLAKVYGTTAQYWEETHASISNDGSIVTWATNWNQHVGDQRVWVMQLNMPAGWAASLASP
jgi:hypothetical protein